MILSEMVHDARIVRMNAEHLPTTIRKWMGGEHVEARARIFASVFIGLLVERLIRDEPLADGEREIFIDRTAALLQSLVDQ